MYKKFFDTATRPKKATIPTPMHASLDFRGATHPLLARLLTTHTYAFLQNTALAAIASQMVVKWVVCAIIVVGVQIGRRKPRR